ncbi:MAG: class I SAM-dependent methyltransferase [Candidatus Omnitrophica bacterium]|nr:class I SAM-dependent methyltransferase [Candidatus Omnitrophota bacterium]
MAHVESLHQKLIRRARYLRYLGKPILWPEFGRRLKYKLFSKREDEKRLASQREEASSWCESRALSSEQALQIIGDSTTPLLPVRETFPGEFAQAERAAAGCPIKMGGAGNLDLLFSLCEVLQAETVLETGVAYGWSSLAILLSLQKRSHGRLYSIDLPYLELQNDRWVGVAVPESLKGRWKLFRMADREGAPRAIRAAQVFDLVHYDSDKSYAGRMSTYRRVWAALRSKGVLMSDDIGDNPAFRDFCEEAGVDSLVVKDGRKYQGVAVKP